MTTTAQPASPFDTSPLWMDHMLALLLKNTREVKGAGVNEEIRRLYEELGVRPEAVDDDGKPWCGVCGAACIYRAGLPYPVRFRAALAFGLWGVDSPLRLGSICVLNRIDPKEPKVPHGHIGFDLVDAHNVRTVCAWAKRPIPKNIDDPALIWLVSGNSHNQVDVSGYDPRRLNARRWAHPDALARAGLDAGGRLRA